MHRLLRESFTALVVLAGSMLFPSQALTQDRPFTPEDMLAVVQISGRVATSPSGHRVAYVLPDMDEDWNALERVPLGTVHVQQISENGAGVGEALALGAPGQRSSYPVFSPDGRYLALYLEEAAGTRLSVWDARTGELRPLGDPFTGKTARAPQWASEDRVVYARPQLVEPAPDPPRVQVIESTDEVVPGDAVFANRRRAGLAVVDLRTGEERTLVGDDEPLRGFAVAPDGRHVIATLPSAETAEVYRGEVNETLLWSLDDAGAPRKFADARERITWLPDGRLFWRASGKMVSQSPDAPGPAESGKAEPFLEDVDAAITSMAWAPDRKRFATLVADPSITDPEIEAPQPGMFSIARPFMDVVLVSPGDGSTTNITERLDDQVGNPVWSADGSTLYFRATDNATYDETIYRYDLEAGQLSEVTGGRESYGPITTVPGGLQLTIQSATTPSELWRIDGKTGTRTRITDLNPQLSDFTFSDPELFHFHDADGERLGALLYRPPGRTEDVPVITYVYEKLTPGIHRFNARYQMFATHGYALLLPNVKVKVGETGDSFVRAVVPAVNAVREMGFTNNRFCMWGGSFGAYATSFVITQTDIFDCAVSRATPPELFRNWASGRDRDSDNIETGQARMGASPFEVMERYLSQSAFFHLDKVETPVLIMHGVKDYTILFGEGEMMFYALRRLGKTATSSFRCEGAARGPGKDSRMQDVFTD